MNVLVLNVGSATLKFQVVCTDEARIASDGDEKLARGQIERIGGDADQRPGGSILVDRIGRGIAVGRGRDVELIDIVDRDDEALGRARAVARRGGDLDRHRRADRFPIDRAGNRDHAGIGVDREQPARIRR